MKIATAALVVGLAVSGCGLFTLDEPYERWDARVNLVETDDGRIVFDPESLEVPGPRGAILVTNTTDTTRGFTVEDLGASAEVDRGESARVQISGAQDGETYAFHDQLHGDEPKGSLVVRYVRQDR